MPFLRSSRRDVMFLGVLIAGLSVVPAAAAAPPESAPLPALTAWKRESVDLRAMDDGAELVVPVNYVIGRAVSPTVEAREGELFTFAADARTRFAFKATPELYRCWIELEFLKKEKVIASAASPELTGTHDSEQPLAVTAIAPAGTDAVRAVLSAQNRLWTITDNAMTVGNARLLSLGGHAGTSIRVDAGTGFANEAGERTATLLVRGDWPDGTAVAVATSRGNVPPSVLLGDGKAQIPLHYQADEVGTAVVTLRLGETAAKSQVADPRAATLTLERVTAEGSETPVLVQLTQNGVMLPGRYQATVPGIYVTPPWSIDLAPGKWQLRVCRGPGFKAADQTLDAKSGETTEIETLDLKPVADLSGLGWYGGDADGDVYHGELIYKDVNARTAADISRAMGLDWVGVGRWGVKSGYGDPTPKTWRDAREFMQKLSGPDLLFLWTDERPKSNEGHACFVGLERPDMDRFGWGWTGTAGRPLRNFEYLGLIRGSGAATFANHPLRWWMKGTRFNTNMYASLPFDLCAAGRLDGLNINDKPDNLRLWSMLLDHGYRIAATAGADFGLDRPGGPPPGLHRMYCFCPNGLSGPALAEAVRNGHTIASTGPTLLADIDGLPPGSAVSGGTPHKIRARAWARGDRPDDLLRLELWSHGKVMAEKRLDTGMDAAETTFEWMPEGRRDWVAVRAVSKGGWAMTSAFYAGDGWMDRKPVNCRLTLDVAGLSKKESAEATVEVWDGPPKLVTSNRLSQNPLNENTKLDVPVTATVVVLSGREKREVTVYDAAGMPAVLGEIASGTKREQPLLEWATYEDVLGRCKSATAKIAF